MVGKNLIMGSIPAGGTLGPEPVSLCQQFGTVTIGPVKTSNKVCILGFIGNMSEILGKG